MSDKKAGLITIVRYFNKKLLNENFSTVRELTNCTFCSNDIVHTVFIHL